MNPYKVLSVFSAESFFEVARIIINARDSPVRLFSDQSEQQDPVVPQLEHPEEN